MNRVAAARKTLHRLRLVACAALLLAPAVAVAQEDAVAEAAASPLQLEVKASRLPQIEPQDPGFAAARVDLSVLPASGSGLGVMAGVSHPPAPHRRLQAAPGQPPGGVDLGVHWRHTFASDHQLDLTAWRRMAPPPDAYTLALQRQPVYGARVELNLKPARKTRLAAASGFIGMQLQSGARISIKRKDGRPMVYYRTHF